MGPGIGSDRDNPLEGHPMQRKVISLPLPNHATLLCALLALCFLGGIAGAQVGPDGQPLSRDEMWRAPTAEEWAQPVLIKWQRSYDDAKVISKETGKPILVCVNMDGEIASEHYAGVRYRQPEIAELYEPYVCVIASVYRHNQRDYDPTGARIPCPRFGTVTCGEHIGIEPGLFDEFFEDTRVAPRHIAVELDSTEMYDVFYAFDTDSVFKQIKDAVIDRPIIDPIPGKSDRSIVDRVQSQDVVDREAVELAYQNGDASIRRELLTAAIQHAGSSQVGIMRLALLGPDLELQQLAWEGLTRNSDQLSVGGGAVDLIAEALRFPMPMEQQSSLISTLEKMGESSFRARRLANVYTGLGKSSDVLDLQLWLTSLRGKDLSIPPLRIAPPEEMPSPDDTDGLVDYAVSLINFAFAPDTDPAFAKLLVDDARQAITQAQAAGIMDWRVSAVLGLSAYFLGETRSAYAQAEGAVKGMPVGDSSPLSMAVLGLFGEARQRGIVGAMRRPQPWPAEWMTDIHSTYTVLLHHPYGTDLQAVGNYDFLKGLEATGHSSRFLEDALARFPDSWPLHERLRKQLLEDRKVDAIDGIETVYGRMLAAPDASPALPWFAGYASFLAAEAHRRIGNPTQAGNSYKRSISYFQEAIESDDSRALTANHHIAMGQAGLARVAYELMDDVSAVDSILASFETDPESGATLDGMLLTPVGTARAILVRLRATNQVELTAKIEGALQYLGKLDPALLELPVFERGGPVGPTNPAPAK